MRIRPFGLLVVIIVSAFAYDIEQKVTGEYVTALLAYGSVTVNKDGGNTVIISVNSSVGTWVNRKTGLASGPKTVECLLPTETGIVIAVSGPVTKDSLIGIEMNSLKDSEFNKLITLDNGVDLHVFGKFGSSIQQEDKVKIYGLVR